MLKFTSRSQLRGTLPIRQCLASRSTPGCHRSYATAPTSSGEPVDLTYDVWGLDIASNKKNPFLILHGLFGSKRNWHSLGKAFAKKLQRPVYALDLRNHGESPHNETMDYITMSTDIIRFCDQHSLQNVTLLGHSMGGKVAMTLALRPDLPSGLLSRLIVGDISPIKGRISSDFQRYIEGMREVEKMGVHTRKEANEALIKFEEDDIIRAFLLTNIASIKDGEALRFRVPLDIISRAIPDIGDFPYLPGEASWEGPALFMKGSKSNYIQTKHEATIRSFFPNMRIETLVASHWLHAEKPADFLNVVSQFCQE